MEQNSSQFLTVAVYEKPAYLQQKLQYQIIPLMPSWRFMSYEVWLSGYRIWTSDQNVWEPSIMIKNVNLIFL